MEEKDESQDIKNKEKETTGKNQEEKKEEPKKESSGMIADAHFAAERLEKANAEKKELLEREERLLVEQKLAGRSVGTQTEEPKKEMSDEEYAKNALNNLLPENE